MSNDALVVALEQKSAAPVEPLTLKHVRTQVFLCVLQQRITDDEKFSDKKYFYIFEDC